MSMKAGSIEADISMNAKPGQDAIRVIKEESRGLKTSVDQSMAGVRNSMHQAAKASEKSWKDSILAIKKETASIGSIARFAMGGGAVGMIAGQLNQASAAMRELVNEFRQGKIEAGEMTEKIIEAVPIIGQAWQMGRNIREMFTGEQAEIDKINEYTKLQNKTFDAIQKHMKDYKAVTAQYQKDRDIAAKMAETYGLSGIEKTKATLEIQRDVKTEDAFKKYQRDAKLDEIKRLENQLGSATRTGNTDLVDATNRELKVLLDQRDNLYKEHLKNVQTINKDIDAQINAAQQNEIKTAAENLKKEQERIAKMQQANIQKVMDDLQTSIRQFDMSPARKLLDDFSKMANVTTEQIEQMRQGVEKLEAMEKDKAAAKLAAEQSKKATEAIAGLQKQADQASMDEYEKMFNDFARDPLFPKDRLDEVEAIIQKLEEANRISDLKKDAEKLKEAILTPQQKLSQTLDKYQDLLAIGEITAEQFDLAAAKARKDIFGDNKLSSLIMSGSAESLAARYDAGRPKAADPNNPQVKATIEGTKAVVTKLAAVQRAIENSSSVVLDVPVA